MNAPRITATLVRGAKIVVFTLVALVALPPLAPSALHAQTAGGAPVVSVQILTPPVTGSGIQQLAFGQAAVGQTVDVPPGAAGPGAPTTSAGWSFGNIRKNRDVSLSLTLPPNLARGTSLLPVDWNNANYATVCLSKGGGCVWSTSYNPGATPSRTFVLPNSLPGNNFDMTIYVGGRITIPAGLPPGLYSASVTATFAYVN